MWILIVFLTGVIAKLGSNGPASSPDTLEGKLAEHMDKQHDRHYPTVMDGPAGWTVYCTTCTARRGMPTYPCQENKWVVTPPPILIDPALLADELELIKKTRILVAAYEFARLPVPPEIQEYANREVEGKPPLPRFAIIPENPEGLPPMDISDEDKHQLLTNALAANPDIENVDETGGLTK